MVMVWVIFVALVAVGAASGALFKPGRWYDALHKPSWTPPDWAFPVVWTVLYALIAWAGVRIWSVEGFGFALGFWAGQWGFNTAWSWLFFGRRRMDLAFLDVTLLWLSVLCFMVAAWPVDPLASLLFLPYLVWVSLAAWLNLTVWRLNPGARHFLDHGPRAT